MKKLITSLVITTSVLASIPAQANSDVVGALIIGGLIGHVLTDNDNKQPQHPPRRNDRYVYQGTGAYPIYVPQPVYTPPPRVWSPNPVYELMPVYDSSCGCHVLMPVRVR